MGEVSLLVDDLKSSSYMFGCRICHEEEGESLKTLEAPCACSGTVKFAHRDCIQRWCNEKGSTTCEICLQEYRPGYTAPSKKSELIEAAVTIRESFQIPTREEERRRRRRRRRRRSAILVRVEEGADLSECNSAADRGASCCRSLALTLMVVLLIKHALEVLSAAPEDYPCTLFTVLVLKACGIMLPMLLVSRTISLIRKNLRRLPSDAEDDSSSSDDYEEEEDIRQRLHVV